MEHKKTTEAQKKANKKYSEKNRLKINERRKVYYRERVKRDPSFLEYKRIKSREYYIRKKLLKQPQNVNVGEVFKIVEE